MRWIRFQGLRVVNSGLNTLADFRFSTRFRAQAGGKGRGSNCTGKGGDDMYVPVPLGTLVRDADTEEAIGDLTHDGQILLVAKGGDGGLGNVRFKSSTNRSPTRTIPGGGGERRELILELQVLADVGLLGLPNAGKSTFLRAVSQARPKVADYPFTTLHPQLGVVRLEAFRSFVIADIPGLIEGAAEGAGLGIRFLKHLARTRVLLHLVDLAPLNPDADVLKDVKSIAAELKKFSPALARRERWLVFNKSDLLSKTEADKIRRTLVKALKWKGPVFSISGLTGAGCKELCGRLMDRLEERKTRAPKRGAI